MGARVEPELCGCGGSVYFDTLLGLIKACLYGCSVNWFRRENDCCGTRPSPFSGSWSGMAWGWRGDGVMGVVCWAGMHIRPP